MQLKEILSDLEFLNDNLTIYAQKKPQWSNDSEAIAVFGYDEMKLEEFQYFLEVDLAKEVVEVWSKWHDGRKPSIEDICKAVIYYAEYDAYTRVNL